MNVTDFLTAFGCDDICVTLARFLGDEKFYFNILSRMIDDNDFDALAAPLRNNDAASAFEIAHSLKGIIDNCGITPMHETIYPMVETLRGGSTEGLMPWYDRLLSQREQLRKRMMDGGVYK